MPAVFVPATSRPSSSAPERALADLLAAAVERPYALGHGDLARLVALEAPEERRALYEAAYRVKLRQTGPRVFLRGLLEIGNVCAKNCLYCGLRRDNPHPRRYQIPEDDIVRMARWAFDQRFGSVVLQSGEIESDAHTESIGRVVRRIRAFGGDSFAIVLSLGEQTEEVYRLWKEAGAARYLLRIETSRPALYARLHPADHRWSRRRDCLLTLKRLGYQLGTGVMIGLPGQTPDDLAADLEFFRDIDADMLGMGPFLPHSQTPLGTAVVDPRRQLELGLNMVAAARLYLHDRNLAATTVLQSLAPDGREQALRAGANVLMPNVTDRAYRRHYLLYENKPCTDEAADECRLCLLGRVASVGETIAWGDPGTPPHFATVSP